MSTVHVYLISCDGCGKRSSSEGNENAFEARAAAYSEGWKFPSMKKLSGAPSVNTSDVCPDCAPTWVTRQTADTWKGRKVAGA